MMYGKLLYHILHVEMSVLLFFQSKKENVLVFLVVTACRASVILFF